jgi:dTDP-4-amino-4,6-dideoxygalactose transaminase
MSARVTHWAVPLADVVVPEDDIAAVADTYRSGWLTMGPQTEAFEREFAAYTGARHAVATASGTAALHLAGLVAGLEPGDEVIVPALTFVATVDAIAYTGATPVFAEVAGADQPWLSASAAEASVSDRTKAIVSMPYGGHPGETEALADLARQRGLLLLEDAAHATGSRVDGRHLGTFGAVGAFSFFSNKNLAVGEGGMLVTDDGATAEQARLLRSHGLTTSTWDRHLGRASGYDVVELGFNYRIDEPRSALARARLARLDGENDRRRALDARYRQALAEAPGLITPLRPPIGSRLSHHLFTILVEEGVDRDGTRRALADRGIETGVHYPPVHHFAAYAPLGAELPLTDLYARRTITLPLFAHMTHAQQDLVIDAVTGATEAAPA